MVLHGPAVDQAELTFPEMADAVLFALLSERGAAEVLRAQAKPLQC
jgi:hypothetical protein